MVKKCWEMSLVAKALRGLLRFKSEEKEWHYIMESNLWSLIYNETYIMFVLRLNHLNLPIKLKQCYAYYAIFSKDEIIVKQYLIDLWMTNGFISSNGILDVEDVGEGAWNKLYWRSFSQYIKTYDFGQVTSFTMQDFVHDLAQFLVLRRFIVLEMK